MLRNPESFDRVQELRTALRRARPRRREFLHVGALSAMGLSLPTLLRAQAAAKVNDTSVSGSASGGSGFGRAKRCLLVWLFGGPSQLDTFDMKPDAASEVRGPLKSIPTNVEGIRVSELLPRLSRHADKYKIIRSVTHHHAEHSAGLYTMTTGTPYPRPAAAPVEASPEDHPHLGSIYAQRVGWNEGIPPFVTLPGVISGSGVGRWPGQGAGFLGAECDPVVIFGGPATQSRTLKVPRGERPRFEFRDLQLPPGITRGRIDRRRSLARKLDRTLGALTDDAFKSLDVWNQRAISMLGSTHLDDAVDLTRESESIREQYGDHLWGQGLLTCRRLLEAGVPLVNLYWFDPESPGDGGGEFDSHGRIYHHYPHRLCPPADRGIAALFEDLSQRGLLDDTLVAVMGEFGRTPRINGGAGRDHWPGAQSILLAGAGITGGQIYGKTDTVAGYPIEDAVPSESLGQTLLHLLGVPSDYDLYDPEDRPIPACRGEVIPELFA